MKTKVIAINGYSRAGKDSFVNFCQHKKGIKVEEHSTIDTVKNILRCLLNPAKKSEKERVFLMSVKQAWIKYNDGPFREVLERVGLVESMYQYMNDVNRILYFVHIREPEEIKKLADYFGADFHSVWVDRKYVTSQLGDSTIDAFPYDFIVKNHGDLDDLSKEADRFLEYLREEFK